MIQEQPGRDAEKERNHVLALLEAHLDNIDRFHSIECRFTVQKRIAPSLVDVKKGQLPLYIEAEGYWLRHGSKQLFSLKADPRKVKELMFHPDNMQKHITGEISTPIPIAQMAFLDDGKMQLVYDPAINYAFIRSEAERKQISGMAPLDMGGIYSERYIQELIKKINNNEIPPSSYSLSSTVQDNRKLLLLEMKHLSKPEQEKSLLSHKFFYDPQQGYALFRHEHYHNGKLILENMVRKMKELEHAWFPMSRVLHHQSPVNDTWMVYEIETSEIQIRKPAEREFFLRLPQGLNITPDETLFPWLQLNESEIITLDGLKPLLERTIRSKEEKKKKMNDQSRQTSAVGTEFHETNRWLDWLKIVVGASVLSLGCVFLLRRPSTKTTETQPPSH